MNFKGLIAGMLSLLVTGATFAFAVSAATTLDSYPTFLASGGQLNAYVVVGSGGTDPSGLASDIAGAVDIAVRLSELQYTKTTVAGGTSTSVDGVEKQIPFAGVDTKGVTDTTDGLPSTLQTFHFSGLKQGTITWKGTAYRYHEEVLLGTSSLLKLDHAFSDAKVNGTMTLRVATSSPIMYTYKFDETLATSASVLIDYTNTLPVIIAGKEFVIVGASASGLTALSGNIGTVDKTTGVTYSGYGVYATDGASGDWAKIEIRDASGNVQTTDILNQGDVKTYTMGSTTFKVKVITVFASTITNTVSAKVAIGSEVEKVYPTSANADSKYVFPDETDWYIYWNDTDSSTNITANDKIVVFYQPTDIKYLKAGEKLIGPGGYFELSYETLAGFDKAATETVSIVSGKSIYSSGTSTSTFATGLNGFEATSDTKGSLLIGSEGYDKVYVLFNATHAFKAYWDSVSSKIVVSGTPFDITAISTSNIDFNTSYGGVGGVTDKLRFALKNPVNNTDWIDVKVLDINNANAVTWDFDNTTYLENTTVPTFRLGATASSAETADITVAYVAGDVTVGDKSQDVLSNTPIYVVAPSSNAASDKAVYKIPSDTVKAKVAFGKIGATTTTGGGTYYNFAGPIVSAVAKLDSSLTTTEKAAKNLIVVGGPCVNSISAEVLGLTYPTCGADSTVPENAAMIKVVDDKFTTGLKTVLIAGWSASDTRLASDVLQNYDQATVSSKLVGKSSVTVSGTSVATATIS